MKCANQKQKFRGVLARFGTKRNWKTGNLETTIMLINVKNYAGKLVADHLWFNMTKKLKALNLKIGDIIQFYGIIKAYLKGYEKDILDYKISYPSQIVKLNKTKYINEEA